jgi:hypothetical protein
MGDGRSIYRVLVGKPESKKQDNIKVDFQEVGCGVWTGSSWLGIGTVGGNF